MTIPCPCFYSSVIKTFLMSHLDFDGNQDTKLVLIFYAQSYFMSCISIISDVSCFLGIQKVVANHFIIWSVDYTDKLVKLRFV